MKILDLGTGSGYLAFPIAKENAGCDVVGLDIVKEALLANRVRAEKEGTDNLTFMSYDGTWTWTTAHTNACLSL